MSARAAQEPAGWEFDHHWNSEHARPMAELRPTVPDGALDGLRHEPAEFFRQQRTSVYVDALEHSALAESLRARTVEFGFGQARVIHDSPGKLAREGAARRRLPDARNEPQPLAAD